MSVTLIIGFYMGVSLLMVVFDLVFLVWEKVRARRMAKRSAHMARELQREVARNLDFPTPEHRALLERQLIRLPGMESFDVTMERMQQDAPAESERYLRGIAPVFDRIVESYAARDDLRRAYFAEMLRKWYRADALSPMLRAMLLTSVEGGSFYVRQNALAALAQLGTAAELASSLDALDRSLTPHHRRLITETLLSFHGDKEELADQLAARRGRFASEVRVAMVNFMRMAKVGRWGKEVPLPPALATRPVASEHPAEAVLVAAAIAAVADAAASSEGAAAPKTVDRHEILLSILYDEDEDREVRLACVRFFAANPNPDAYPALCEMALCKDPEKWEYAAVAATALGSYRGSEAVGVLKECLRSPVYYVRLNSARALHAMGLTLEDDLADVLEGSDRFAREMVLYQWRTEGGAL